jgi:hypothetical protein
MIFNIKINKNKDRFTINLRKIEISYLPNGSTRKIKDSLIFSTNDLTIDFSQRLTPFVDKHIKDVMLNHKQYNSKIVQDMSKFINKGICFNGESEDFYTLDYFNK